MKQNFFLIGIFLFFWINAQEKFELFPAKNATGWISSSNGLLPTIEANNISSDGKVINTKIQIPLEDFQNKNLHDDWTWEMDFSLDNGSISTTYFVDFFLYQLGTNGDKKNSILLSLKDKKFTVFGNSFSFDINGIDFKIPKKFKISKTQNDLWQFWIDGQRIFENQLRPTLADTIPSFGLEIGLGTRNPNFRIENLKITIFPKTPIVNVCENTEKYSIRINEIAYQDLIELYNPSEKKIHLKNWTLTRKTETKEQTWILPDLYLEAGAYLALTNNNFFDKNSSLFEAIAFWKYETNLGLTSSTGNFLELKNCQNELIDQVLDLKIPNEKISLQLKNPGIYCYDEKNWEKNFYSIGEKNTINTTYIGAKNPPILYDIFWEDEKLALIYDQNISNTKATTLSAPLKNLQVDPKNTEKILITVEKNAFENYVQNITQPEVLIQGCNYKKTPLAFIYGQSKINSNDKLVINELMIHTKKREKYIEIYNPSSKIINLENRFLGYIYSGVQKWRMPLGNRVILPDQYLVFTKNKAKILEQHQQITPIQIIESDNFPSFGNTGQVLLSKPLVDNSIVDPELILDQVDYSEKNHHPLLQNTQDIALEKIDPLQKNRPQNWSSAQKNSGYASPGQKNSLFKTAQNIENTFVLENELFTPHQMGDKQNVLIRYNSKEEGAYVSILIYNEQGHLMKKLIQNEPLEGNGFFLWDGTNTQNKILPIGIYILHIIYSSPATGTENLKKIVTIGNFL